MKWAHLYPYLLTTLLLLPASGWASPYNRYRNAKPPEPFKIVGTAHIGFRGGLGSSSLTGYDIGNDSDPARSSNAGMFITYWMTNTIAIETELNYLQVRGVQTVFNFVPDPSIRGGGYSYYDDIGWRITYLEVPVLIRWATSDVARNPDGSLMASAFEPYFEFGSSISFKLAQGHTDNITTTPAGVTPDIDYLNWGSTNIALVVGSGANIKLGPGFITMQARFSAGFATIGQGFDDAYSTTIAFLFGYGWRIR